MSRTIRFAVFLLVVLGVWSGMHYYVLSRLVALPVLEGERGQMAILAAMGGLWLCFPLGRILARGRLARMAPLFEWAGGLWLGVLFLMVWSLLLADLATGFGRLAPALATPVRELALGLAGLLSLVAVLQARRPPAVREEEVTIPRLPPERDGLVLVQISDLHLGTMLGPRWAAQVVKQVLELGPDLIAVTGDVVDGAPETLVDCVPILARLQAPLGVWAVTGNHEYYSGLEGSLRLFERAGFRVLRDRWELAAPGLVLAGVDDLTARRQLGLGPAPLEVALAGRPAGATILLSHSPLAVGRAARLGAGLMLCGHTHGGQIWPFGWLVGRFYPDAAPRRDRDGMTLIVSRGTGTWGPRMRLFHRSEIVRIRLRRNRA